MHMQLYMHMQMCMRMQCMHMQRQSRWRPEERASGSGISGLGQAAEVGSRSRQQKAAAAEAGSRAAAAEAGSCRAAAAEAGSRAAAVGSLLPPPNERSLFYGPRLGRGRRGGGAGVGAGGALERWVAARAAAGTAACSARPAGRAVPLVSLAIYASTLKSTMKTRSM